MRIVVLVCAIYPWGGVAQTAADYFHRGAQFYIWNEKQKATNEIYTGLSLFPTDPQLNGLANLLKKEDQKQDQQQQNQQNNQSKQDQNQQQQQSQQKQGSSEKDQQSQPGQQAKQDQQQQQQQQAAKQAQEQKQNQQQPGQAAEQQKEKSDEKDQQATAEGQMTPEQARQLLDSQKGDEKILNPKQEGKPADTSKPIRDW